MNILVTGANGFVGSNIVDYLQKNTNHVVFKGTRTTINLLSIDDIKKYIEENKIESIIHCAIEGGRRNVADKIDIVYNNILIAQNLLTCNIPGHFINIASGAEFDRKKDIFKTTEENIYTESPTDYYGMSKNIISKLVNNRPHGINLRIFGCFNYNEEPFRLIKSSIIKYINKEPITIIQDRYMDYVYVIDLCRYIEGILQYSVDEYDLHFCEHNDVNICYNHIKKYKISDIINIINNLDIHKVPVIIENNTLGLSYCGDSHLFNSYGIDIQYIGLEEGIKECYKQLRIINNK